MFLIVCLFLSVLPCVGHNKGKGDTWRKRLPFSWGDREVSLLLLDRCPKGQGTLVHLAHSVSQTEGWEERQGKGLAVTTSGW